MDELERRTEWGGDEKRKTRPVTRVGCGGVEIGREGARERERERQRDRETERQRDRDRDRDRQTDRKK